MKVPKTESTRFILPRGVAGTEPANADEGTLSYDAANEVVRVKTASGWQDVGSGGGGGAPSGPAGGDLGGTYPNPSVVRAEGLKSATTTVDVSGATAPSSGQALVATSSTAASWQTLSSSPSGSAGGDLGGSYPNPSVVRAEGLKSATTTVSVSGATAPSAGQALVATSSTAATWQTLSLTGSAGGDLGGSYPNPSVAKITTTSGPTSLTIGSIADGQALIRSGSNIIGASLVALSDRPGFPYLSKPSSPDSWNLEARDMTDPDLAANGWTITLLDSPWTVQTRSGAVDMSTNPSANTYRSTLANGILTLQLPSGTAVTVYKATTASAFTYSLRAWATVNLAANANGMGLMLSDNVQRKAVGARNYYTSIEATTQIEATLVGPSTFNLFVNTAPPDGVYDTIKYLHYTAASNIVAANAVSPFNGRIVLNGDVPTNRTFTLTPTICAFFFASGAGREIFHFDYIRRYPLWTRFPT